MSVAADHQIRATTMSGGWDYENCETAKLNINRKERQALAELKKSMILPADKGKATVVMNTDEYY